MGDQLLVLVKMDSVTSNGGDQNSNVVRSSDYWANLISSSCKNWCDHQSVITGCEFIWGQSNYGCYAHNSAVSYGNGVGQHYCWIAKRRNLEAAFTNQGKNHLEGSDRKL